MLKSSHDLISTHRERERELGLIITLAAQRNFITEGSGREGSQGAEEV